MSTTANNTNTKYFSFRSSSIGSNEIRLRESQATASNLGTHFQIAPESIYLKECYGENTEFQDGGRFQLGHFTDNHVFIVVDGSRNAIQVGGAASAFQQVSTPIQVPNPTAASTSASRHQAIARRSAILTVKVVRCDLDPTGKPTNILRRNRTTYINIYSESEATVTHITNKVREAMNDETLVLVDPKGSLIFDEEGTRGSSFWKVGSRKVYAVEEAEIERHRLYETDEDDALTPLDNTPSASTSMMQLRKRKNSSQALEETVKRLATEVNESNMLIKKFHAHGMCNKDHFSLEFLKVLHDAFECCVCKASPCNLPIIACKECKTIIGCGSCVDRWYSGDQALTKKCPKCRADRGFASTMELKGMDSLVKKLKEIAPDTDDEGGDDDSLPSTLPLVYPPS